MHRKEKEEGCLGKTGVQDQAYSELSVSYI